LGYTIVLFVVWIFPRFDGLPALNRGGRGATSSTEHLDLPPPARIKVYTSSYGRPKTDPVGRLCLRRSVGIPDRRPEGSGFQLGKVQAGLEPTDWKPFDDVGAGTKEIRIREASRIYRVMYVAKFEEAVYVLHCFQKKTQVTSQQDKSIAATHYRAVVNARKEKK
jgi:phage-related protein